VAAVLFFQLNPARWVGDLRWGALNATIVLTALSGLHYAWVASRRAGSNGVRHDPARTIIL